MYLKKYLKVLENIKYFIKVIKYKYFQFLNIKYKYFTKVLKYYQKQMYLTPMSSRWSRPFAISACFGDLGQCAAVISACGEVISACATVISACIGSDAHHILTNIMKWYNGTAYVSCCKNMQCIKNLWRSVVISFRSSCCKNEAPAKICNAIKKL